MAEIIPLRSAPIIRVDPFGGLWGVSIRPCPDGVLPLKSFGSATEAAEYAASLRRQHGGRIRPEHFDLTGAGRPPEAA